jgi:hypothetical protein
VVRFVEENAEEAIGAGVKELGWRLAEVAADMVMPGLGGTLHTAERIYEAAMIATRMLDGDGVQLVESLRVDGVSLDLGVTVGADRPVSPVSVSTRWIPLETSGDARLAFSVDPGQHSPWSPPESNLELRWYELQRKSAEPTAHIRAAYLESVTRPHRTRVVLPEPIAGLVVAAPIQRIAGGSGRLSARKIIEFSQDVGAIEADAESSDYHLLTGRRSDRVKGRRRRRISSVTYLEPSAIFLATIDLTASEPPRFAEFIVEPGRVPAGVPAWTVYIHEIAGSGGTTS